MDLGEIDDDDVLDGVEQGSSKGDPHRRWSLEALPKDGGIWTDIGGRRVLFHHASTYPIIQEWTDRLLRHKEEGYTPIRLKAGPRFTESEKQLIRRNWETYAKTHKLKHSDIFDLRFPKDDRHQENRQMLKETAFWPIMCTGLEDRSADQVRKTIYVVFAPEKDPHFDALTFVQTPSLLSRFLRARADHEDNRIQVAHELGISYRQINVLYRTALKTQADIAGHKLVRMWRYIPLCFGASEQHKRLRKAFQESRPIKRMTFNYTKLGFLMDRMPETCKRTFEKFYPLVCDVVAKEKITGDQAIMRLSGCTRPPLQRRDLCTFVRILLDQLSPRTGCDVGVTGDFRRVQKAVEQEMLRLGVLGFYTGPSTEFRHCQKRMMQLIANIRRHIIPRLRVDYAMKDLLTVTVRTLEESYVMEEPEEEKEKDKGGRRKGVLSVSTGDLLAHLFLYTKEELDKAFVPPDKFKRFIPPRFSRVLSLFDESRGDEYYFGSRHASQAKKFVRSRLEEELSECGLLVDDDVKESDGCSDDELSHAINPVRNTPATTEKERREERMRVYREWREQTGQEKEQEDEGAVEEMEEEQARRRREKWRKKEEKKKVGREEEERERRREVKRRHKEKRRREKEQEEWKKSKHE